MSRILTVALNPAIDISCEAERIQPTLKVRTVGQELAPGGGGTNVARVISELGGAPELAYLSGGITGALFDNLLSNYDLIRHRFSIEGSVRTAFMVHEAETDFEYRFIPEGPIVLNEEIEPMMKHIRAFDGDYLVASGSLPRGLPTDTYAHMANEVTGRGTRFILDTSGGALRAFLDNAQAFLIKPSLRELETFVGRKLDEDGVQTVSADLIARGVAEHIVVSLGREGALLANSDGIVRLPSMHVKTASAVGAGDSVVGAMTWWLSQGRPIEEAFRFGIAAGAASVMTSGTQLCRREDVFALFEEATSKGS